MSARCYVCDVPLRRANVSPVTDDACRQCVPAPVTDHEMAEAMCVYGGAFVSALGEAWYRGDNVNRAKLVAAFSEYATEYRDLARLKRERAKT